MKLHDFNERLAFSQSYSDAGWWLDVYRKAFPRLVTFAQVRNDGWAQRAGIDRILTLSCGRQIKIDEKVREKDWPDFALEQWSDTGRKTPGWIQKPLDCDFIAYAFIPSQTCYLLPTDLLQRAWRLYGRDWILAYPTIEAHNRNYITTSVCVPKDVVLSAISSAIVVRWQAAEAEA